jgi:hypothetical protein
MYEADSSVVLTYDRAASKAASRSRSRASPASQPIAIPPVPAPPPKPTPTPIAFPTAADPHAAGSSTAPVKRTVIQKPKTTRPRPKPKVVAKEPTPPPASDFGEAEEGEELEPVSVPGQTSAMDLDTEQGSLEDGGKDSESADVDGILPWDAVPTTSHRRMASVAATFSAADEPEEEVIVFGGSFGATTREPPRKTQPKSGRSGIVFPKAGRGRDPPPRAPPPPPVQQPEPDDDEMFDMDEVVLPGMESHSRDLEVEMMRQLQGGSSEEDDDDEDDDDDDDDEDGDGGFDVQAFEQALAQEVPQEDDGELAL